VRGTLETLQQRVHDKTSTLNKAQRETRRLRAVERKYIALQRIHAELRSEHTLLKRRFASLAHAVTPSLDTTQKALAAVEKENRAMRALLESKGYTHDYRTDRWQHGGGPRRADELGRHVPTKGALWAEETTSTW